jgi:hypothetical protein
MNVAQSFRIVKGCKRDFPGVNGELHCHGSKAGRKRDDSEGTLRVRHFTETANVSYSDEEKQFSSPDGKPINHPLIYFAIRGYYMGNAR